MTLRKAAPKLSVIVVCYEMAEQIANTLRSLVPSYQRNIALDDYEIILLDNGSRKPLAAATQSLAPNLHYVYLAPGELELVPLYEGSVFLEIMLTRLRNLNFSLCRIRPGFSDPRSGRMLQVDGIFFRDGVALEPVANPAEIRKPGEAHGR